MDDLKSTEEQGGDVVRGSRKKATRWWLLPASWMLLGVGLVLYLWLRDQPRDVRSVAQFLTFVTTLVLLTFSFVFRSHYSRSVRWGVGIVATLLGLFIYYGVDLINDGDGRIVSWRFVWDPLPDQKLELPVGSDVSIEVVASERDFPRFLGRGHWAEVAGVILAPDWELQPPREVWRREIGAGWSAFSVVGDYAFTQEQRGDQELVTCSELQTGQIVWSHQDPIRFDPQDITSAMGGVGPRATPTVHEGRVYTQGATGIINALDAETGELVWSCDPRSRFGAGWLKWGQSGSPLVLPDRGLVIVNIGPEETDKEQTESRGADYPGSVIALALETGELVWGACKHTTSYASPVFATLAGLPQVIQVNENFVTAHHPDDGRRLWEHDWPGVSSANASCSQPVPIGDDRLLLTKGYGIGAELLEVESSDDGCQVGPVWSPPRKRILKTKLGNVVVRDGYAYGIDDVMLQCVEIATGKKKWKKRRSPAVGHGQILLIGDLLVVLTEIGELLLVDCTPEKYRELSSIQALGEDEVTWNNLAYSHPYLLVRNSHQAVCYELPASLATEAAGE